MCIRSLLLYFLSKRSEIVYYSCLEMFGTLSLHQSGRTYILKTKEAASHAILETFIGSGNVAGRTIPHIVWSCLSMAKLFLFARAVYIRSIHMHARLASVN